MNKAIRAAAVVAGLGLLVPVAAQHALAQTASNTVMVGGSPMYPSKNIVQNAVNSSDHTTLVAAVKAAGLVGALEGPGPFTVFAPTNEAFGDLPAGTVATLVKPENKATLTKILTYHVVPGDYNTTKLRALILAGGGKAQLKTLEGGMLTFMMNGSSNIVVEDAKGDKADITVADVTQSNGVIQVIDKVLLPG
ncbi:MAG: fasciclin domain-containing protein [Proteobacteria bacterium]|nr:fasciclin domain-containing protein [Pseudomonadota bacterium]